MPPPECIDCKYFNQMGQVFGLCHRYPPQVYADHQFEQCWVFPEVNTEDWCGEFAPKIYAVED